MKKCVDLKSTHFYKNYLMKIYIKIKKIGKTNNKY